MSEPNIFLFVPNLIGYGRIIFGIISFILMPNHPLGASICYFLSAFLDAFDGHAARALNQSNSSDQYFPNNFFRYEIWSHVGSTDG